MPRKTMKPRNMTGKAGGVSMKGKGMPRGTRKGMAASMKSKGK